MQGLKTKKRNAVLAMALVAAAASLIFVIQKNSYLKANPFEKTFTLDYPSYASSDSSGNLYVIDTSRVRVIKSDPRGVVSYIIDGGGRDEGRFFYAAEVVPGPDDSLYILNQVLDISGFFTEREQILKFDKNGDYTGTVFSITHDTGSHDPTIVQRGRLISLSADSQGVRVFEINSSGITLHNIPNGKETESREIVAMKDANLLVSGVSQGNNGVLYYISKQAGIFSHAMGRSVEIMAAAAGSNPWALQAGRHGELYFSDLTAGSIKKFTPDGTVETVISGEEIKKGGFETSDFVYYRMSISPDGRVTTCNEESVVMYTPGKGVVLNNSAFSFSSGYTAARIGAWLIVITGLVSLIFIMNFIYRDILGGRLSSVLINAMAIVTIIGISAAVVSTMIVSDFSARYEKETMNRVSQMVQIVPGVIDVSRLEQVKKRADFMGNDYISVRNQILSALNYNRDEWNNRYYFVLYTVVDEKLRGLMYHNGEIGLDYPFNYFDDPESVYRKSFSGEIASETSVDAWGSWIYAVGPVKNREGKVVALFEAGSDLYTFQQENSRLAREIILDVVTMLVMLILLMIEMTYFVDLIRKRDGFLRLKELGKKVSRNEDRYTEAFIVRPLAFLFTAAVSISVAFIPIMAKKLHAAGSGGLSEEFATGLPISAEMLMFGAAMFTAGRLIPSLGWRKMLRAGFLLTFTGLMFSAMAPGIWTFIASRALVGFGSGSVLLALRSFINMEKDETLRSDSYSSFYAATVVGLSIGAVTGGLMADKYGFEWAFYGGSLILLLAFAFELKFIGSSRNSEEITNPHPAGEISVREFFFDKKVAQFFLLVIIPTYAASSFLTYFFPLFAESAGITTANIGRLFIVNGLFIIYLGPALGSYLNRKIGFRNTTLAGSAAWAISLLVFALTGNIGGAVIALIFMGITEGFCVAGQNGFFLELRQVARTGVDRAVGYFELTGKFGETVSPMIFAAALTLGQGPGVGAIAAGIVLCTVIFSAVSGKEK